MLKSITLDGFKCFQGKKELNLSQITIMYGRNGCGKSTAAQSLLLLAQTMVDNNDISKLQLTGRYVALGTFADIINSSLEKESFGLTLKDEKDVVELRYEPYPDKPQMARIEELNVNGKTRFDEVAEMGKIAVDTGKRSVGATSDISLLQMLKSTRYVSAGRLGPINSILRKDSLDDDDLGVNGEYLINVLSRKGLDFIIKVENTLRDVLGGAAIKVVNKDSERIELFLNSKNSEETFRPVNVGFGYSYLLPVIIAAYLAQSESLLIIENPEAHLHPSAQSKIMNFLISIAKEKNLQIIIETHSDHVVNGMRIAMKNKVIGLHDAHVLYFSDKQDVKMITCDSMVH